jgi:hypothetical protein
MNGGIALTVLGGVSLIGAAAAFGVDTGNQGDFQGVLSILVGLPLLVHGAGCLAGGIPMIVIGNKDIPEGSASLLPTIVPARGGAALRWQL